MLVKESSFPSLEMPEVGKAERRTLESLFWWDFHVLGINLRSVDVLGDRVLISDGKVDLQIPVGVLSAGISVLENDEGKRLLMKDRPFERQIGYLAWKGRREGRKG